MLRRRTTICLIHNKRGPGFPEAAPHPSGPGLNFIIITNCHDSYYYCYYHCHEYYYCYYCFYCYYYYYQFNLSRQGAVRKTFSSPPAAGAASQLFICIYIYIYIYIHIYIYIYIHIHIHTYICIYIYIYIYIQLSRGVAQDFLFASSQPCFAACRGRCASQPLELCVYIYIYIYICVQRERQIYRYRCVCIYIYIYMWRERERNIYLYVTILYVIDVVTYKYMYMYVYVYIYIYTPTYMSRSRRSPAGGSGALWLAGALVSSVCLFVCLRTVSSYGRAPDRVAGPPRTSDPRPSFPLTYFCIPRSARAYLFANYLFVAN